MSNRSVSTDALETLGTIIDDTQKRDAIHLAVLPMIAGCDLPPGCRITIEKERDGETRAYPVSNKPALGIVDPFLAKVVTKGQVFWMVLMPRQVTSLRHVWKHPCFEDADATVEHPGTPAESPEMFAAKTWMKNFANRLGVDQVELMENAAYHLRTGEYWNRGEQFEGEYIPDEFWAHYDTITGKDSSGSSNRDSFLSCSC